MHFPFFFFFSFFIVFHPKFLEPNTKKKIKNQMRYYFPTFIFVNGSLEFNAYRITMVNSIMSKKKSTEEIENFLSVDVFFKT